jgi:hypothetical protein
MVYHGPSRGCVPCRKRKVKCDLHEPECHKCVQRGEPCPGPRLGLTVVDMTDERIIASTGVLVPISQKSSTDPRRSRSPFRIKAQNASASPRRASITPDASDDVHEQGVWKFIPSQLQHELNLATLNEYQGQMALSSPVNDKNDDLDLTTLNPQLFQTPADSQYGNGSLGIFRLDQTLQELIEFFKCCTSPGSTGPVQRSYSMDIWPFSLLWHPTLGTAWLFSVCCCYQTYTRSNRMDMAAMKYRTEAIRLLREELAKAVSNNAAQIATSIMLAELASGDYLAVTLHSQFMARYMQAEEGLAEPPPQQLRHLYLWIETQRAVRTLTRPLISIDEWTRTITTDLDLTESLDRADDNDALDSFALGDKKLVELFHTLQQYDTLLASLSAEEKPRSLMSKVHLSSKLLLLESRLVEYCVCSMKSVDEGIFTQVERLQQCQQAAAALAALWWLRLRSCTEPAGPWRDGLYICEIVNAAGPQILQRIQKLLLQSEDYASRVLFSSAKASDTATILPEIRLRIWIFYVGAMIESTARFPKNVGKSAYHQNQLRRYLKVLGLDSESKAFDTTVRGFLYVDKARPYGPEWLSPVLRVSPGCIPMDVVPPC